MQRTSPMLARAGAGAGEGFDPDRWLRSFTQARRGGDKQGLRRLRRQAAQDVETVRLTN